MVRESQGSPGQYVLTGMNNGTPKHLLLIDPEGVVSILEHNIGRNLHTLKRQIYDLL